MRILILIGFMISCCFASQNQLEDMVNAKMSQVQGYLNQNETSMTQLKNKKYAKMMRDQHIKKESQQGVIIFVSLGMPKPALRQLLVQAKAYKIPVQIRGLVNNSFVDTHNRLQEVMRKGKSVLNGGVELNPTWFKQFNITKVPAFVAYKRGMDCDLGKVCQNIHFDVLYGNISLEQALHLLSDKAHSVKPLISKRYLQNYTKEQAWHELTHIPHVS